MFDFTSLDTFLRNAIHTICPAIQLVVRWRGREIFARAYGWLDPELRREPVTLTSRFDLASLTKLFAVTALMRLEEEGALTLEQPVSTVLSRSPSAASASRSAPGLSNSMSLPASRLTGAEGTLL